MDHPQTKATRRTLQQIEQQRQDRADAILYGLQVKITAQKLELDRLEAELRRAKENQIGRTIQQRPYFQAKRELQTLEAVRDEPHKRLVQAQVDAAIEPTSQAK